MFQTEKKLAARINELEGYRYREKLDISAFQLKADEHGEVGASPAMEGDWSTLVKGDTWKGRDRYAWLYANVKLPTDWHNKQMVGVFDFGITDGGTNAGFESLLYVNNTPYQGVDGNHKEVFFSNECAGDTVQLIFRLWSGLEGGGLPVEQVHTFKEAYIAWLDPHADNLFYTGKATLQTIEALDEMNPIREGLLIALNQAFNQVDWMAPASEAFYHSIEIAEKKLSDQLQQMEKHHPVTIHAVGHTHIDVAWLWRLKHTREKTARSFSTVLRLMEKYPDYLFQQAQPQLYDYIKQDYPEIYKQIQQRVKEGRWEPEGGMWVEPDCNLPSGESFIRQLLHGTRFLREEFGVECTYLWLPDVFGYSWALPQILKKSGIDSFVTTKISWNQFNRMPHDVFQWRGIDGTEILTYFITTPYPGRKGWGADYNAEITAETMVGAWEAFKDKGVTKDVMVTYGHGDGGGGVTRDMLEMRRRLNDMPGVPKVIPSKPTDYLKKVHQDVAETDGYVHVWDGELYLEFHRGTYTSQAKNKKSNRKLEFLYKEVELLSVMRSALATNWEEYPQEDLHRGWKIILRNQFHDILPGSSIKEVYEDSKLEYEEAQDLALEVKNKKQAKKEKNKGIRSYTIMNPVSWERRSTVSISHEEEMEHGVWYDHQMQPIQAESVNGEWLLELHAPALGATKVEFHPEQGQGDVPSPFTFSEHAIQTPYYSIEWNKSGHVTRIRDLEHHREVLQENEKGNVFQVFEDKPLRWDAWELDLFYQEKMKEVHQLKSVNLLENNSLRAIVEFCWEYNESYIKQKMIVYANKRRIDFETEVEWKEVHQLLKVAFPVKIRSTEATFDIQFGNVKRPTHWNTSWDFAKFETVGHQWADLSEQGYGVSLLNDCKYGYDIKDAIMRLTLLKGATYPDYEQDQGHHSFTYSLLPHQGSWVEGNTVREAADLNEPLSVLEENLVEANESLFSLSADYVMVDAVKKAEDSNKVVLRLHEFTGRRGEASISSTLSLKKWQECDLMENPLGEVKNQSDISFEINPYEIKSFLVEFN